MPQSSEAPLGGEITVAQMIEDGAVITNDKNGNIAVKATFHKVDNFKEFSSNTKEQSGHYFPAKISGITGETMTLKKNGVSRKDKTNIPFDPEIVVLLSKDSDKLEVTIDGEHKILFTFKGSTFEG